MSDWRLEDILARRSRNQTLAEIGLAHGITRERVRQILNRAGAPPVDVWHERRQAGAEQARLLDEAIGQTLTEQPRLSCQDVARMHETTQTRVKAVAADLGLLARLPGAINPNSWTPRVYTDEEMLDALRACSTSTATGRPGQPPLTSSSYAGWARGRQVPSKATFLLRFTTWSAAVTQAGLNPAPSLRAEYTRIGDDQIADGLRRYLLQEKSAATAARYDLWSRTDESAVSSSLLRLRLGPWSQALEQARQELATMPSAA